MKRIYFKIGIIILLTYALVMGFVMRAAQPAGNIQQSIRSFYFHVPMWFAMMLMIGISVLSSIAYLWKQEIRYDTYARESAHVGVLFGILGYLTGTFWMRFTWGEAWWVADPKLICAAIFILIYFAYFILRNSFEDDVRRARIASVYNIFAAACSVPLLFIVPRILPSLHPGKEGNPALNPGDISPEMLLVFYPALVGFAGLALWIYELRLRKEKINIRLSGGKDY